MKRFKSIIMAVAAVVVVASYALPATRASAVTNDNSAALSIVPKKNYVIEAGKSVKDTLVIRNLDTQSPLQLSLRVIDFTYTDDTGTPKLFFDPKAEPTTWSLKPYLTVPESVTIPPSGSKTLHMEISIPAGHGAGSYYSAIVYSSGSGQGGNVGLSASGVTLVFASIPGKVNEDLQFKKLGPYSKQRGYFWFTTQEPDTIAYTLQNNGNVTESPAGSITLRDMFGHTYTIDKLNPNDSLALIGQTRTFTSCIKSKAQDVNLGGTSTEASTCVSPGLWPGFYSVSADLFYGQNGNLTQEITKTAHFLYLPAWFIILCLVIIAVAAFYIRKFVIAVRRRLYGPQGSSRKSAARRK